MLQLWLIALLAIVYIHDEPIRRGGDALPARFSIETVAWVLIPYAVLAVVQHVVCRFSARQMDRRGSIRAVESAERMLSFGRGLAVAMHAAAVFSAGWLEQVRALVGNRIMLDEIVAVLPPVAAIVLGWWSYYPIERRLRESMWVRVLEEGHPAYPTPSRWQFVWSNVRHQVLFILVPLVLIGAWNEEWRRLLALRGEGMLADLAHWVRKSPYEEAIQLCGQVAGVLTILALSPLLMRAVWDAKPIGPGPLRDRLMAVCHRAGVRVRGLLVWRTHGTMLNGAAMGLIAPLRYILLTDALLDQLPERQVESVMAHEVGHAKHHHIPWMLVALLASLGIAVVGVLVVSVIAFPIVSFVLGPQLIRVGGEIASIVSSIVVTLLAFLAFGWVSRRFEWQADAFAARTISGEDPANTQVTQESVDSMCGALESVARLNHLPVNRRSFRHGSIANRQARLRRLVGVHIDRLPIDRTCRWIKGGIVVGAALMLVVLVSEPLLQWTLRPPPYDFAEWSKPYVSHLEDARSERPIARLEDSP